MAIGGNHRNYSRLSTRKLAGALSCKQNNFDEIFTLPSASNGIEIIKIDQSIKHTENNNTMTPYKSAQTTQILSLALLSGLVSSFAAQAQEVGNVLSRTPVYQQVSVPRQVCTQTQVSVPGQTTGAGALMGAVAGGAIGNAVGKGEGRALATMIGVIGGALAGDKVEGPQAAQAQTQQTCTTQQVYENRLMGYNVVYEFAGKQYTVQLPKDPGPTIKLQITPVI
jgi:uncharacterized protein YcfJ